ncbi:LysR family transcriptional regulator [Prauserella sp. PE36]|uniref:LysR family transcriptional regulator n=1 Tax=Prauserella sp. PE36 TaxID=1504709 RepID=UPI000DE34690|nr:LysR family transcriptional regulator [Prauserella sp. PE36]RBM23395.1 LysR family transcriptional regulator [Prauserella sp. PE36]
MALDVRRLRMLSQLKASGTMAAAARAMNYSPASISQQLAQLERDVGSTLFVTAGRSVRLTPAGTALATRADEIIEALDAAEREVRRLGSAPVGRLRLAIFQSAALAVLRQVYGRLRRDFGGIRLDVAHLEPRVALEELSRHAVDIAVLEEYPGSPLPKPRSVTTRLLTLDPLYLASPAAEHRSAQPDPRARWALEPEGTAARRWAEATCRTAGFEPDVQFESHDLMLHRAAVRAGLAHSFLPGLAVGGSGDDAGIRLDRLPGDPARSIIVAYSNSAVDDPVVSTVAEVLQDSFADNSRSPGALGSVGP